MILGAALAVAYANSLNIGFLFDDDFGITRNPWVRSLAFIPRYFVDPFTLTTVRENVDVRPVLQVTYAFNYAISAYRPWSYHLFNLVIHFAAALMVFVIVRDHLWWPPEERGPEGAGRIPAAGAALLFALAPLNSQPLDYMWARSALLVTALYLAAFLAALEGRRVLMLVLHALALLTKAIAITFPAMIVIHDCIYRDRVREPTLRDWARNWRRLRAPVGATIALDTAYLLYRSALLPAWAESTRHETFVTPGIWFVSQWSALLYYVRLFVFPNALSLDHDFPYTMSALEPRAIVSLIVLVAWIAVAARAARRQPLPAFATAWFFVTLAPESSFAPLSEVINDHRPYIASSLGLSVLASWLLFRLCRWFGEENRRLVFACAVTAVSVGSIAVVVHRNWEYQDEERLWLATAIESPRNGRAWMNAGRVMMSRGKLDAARAAFDRAREAAPDYGLLYANYSVLDAAQGKLDQSLADAQQAVRLAPASVVAYIFLGQAARRLQRYDLAADAYRRALAVDPSAAEARDALTATEHEQTADRLMRDGLAARYTRHDQSAAAISFLEILQIMPDHLGATYQLASALDASGRRDDARRYWQRTLELSERYGDRSSAATAKARLTETR